MVGTKGPSVSGLPNHRVEEYPKKQAACLECRRSKIRCIRAEGADVCKKCQSSESECIVPDYHVGRYKGVKNKLSGLDKALSQVQQALKKAKTNGGSLGDEQTQALHRLLDETTSVLPQLEQETDPESHIRERQHDLNARTMRQDQTHPSQTVFDKDGDDVVVNNADNPLQLLAMASVIPEQTLSVQTASPARITSQNIRNTVAADMDRTQSFFNPMTSTLDVLPKLDPIELGLVTLGEAEMLFEYFHSNLAHTRWGLDPLLHTTTFVRSRSAFLFNSIMASSALFMPDTAAVSKRLSNHSRILIQEVIANHYRSVEIVLAFMINIPWMTPGQNWAADDSTCQYLSLALLIALDLSMNKIVTPSCSTWPAGFSDQLAKSDSIDAKRALEIDGYSDANPATLLARRILRTREKTWLSLYNLDRGICLARGRPWTVPSGPLVNMCDSWHISDIADKQDTSLVSTTVLRRDFSGLISSIRATCDNNHLSVTEGSTVVKYMKEKIEGFFNQWYAAWSFQLRQPNEGLPPYVEILVSHGKLSAYCSVINHPTATEDVKQFFRAAGLTSALNVMKVAIQGEKRLISMPNNTVIMVSFAACFVLGLSTSKSNNQAFLAPTSRKTIDQTAAMLERIGSLPEHRHGASRLFGQHIKRYLQLTNRVESAPQLQDLNSTIISKYPELLPGVDIQQPNTSIQDDFPIFDMTDDQIIEAITTARDDIDSISENYQADDGLFMDWLDWPNMTW